MTKKDIVIDLDGQSFDNIDPELMLKCFLDKFSTRITSLIFERAQAEDKLLFGEKTPTESETLLLTLTILG